MLLWLGLYTFAALINKIVCSNTTGTASNPDQSPEDASTRFCRDRDGYWPEEDFNLRSCANCYGFLFRETRDLRPFQTVLYSVNDSVYPKNTILLPDIHNETSRDLVCRTLLNKDECDRWRFCCLEAEECCRRSAESMTVTYLKTQASKQNSVDKQGTSKHCPATWDGFGCWRDTPVGQEVSQSCPSFIPHAIPSVNAYKFCHHNGSWFKNADTGLEWTNYTTCMDLDHFKKEFYTSLACNGASILLLVPAILVFLAYRSLRKQHRIRLHLQLFLSFLLNAVITILWEVLVVYDRMNNASSSTLMHRNTVGCKFLYVLTRYTKSTNFLWMLFEGYYLHRLIVKAFQPPKSLVLFYIVGWGFPWIPVTIYSILKSVYMDESCWIKNLGASEWLIYVPNLVCLVANMFFLFDILRILLTQLQSHPNEPSNYRRALKATATLVPLFGLQLVAIIYRPPPAATGAKEYEMISVFVTYSQGFFVALIFCFLNHEALSHLKMCFKANSFPRLRRYRSSRYPSVLTQATLDGTSKDTSRRSNSLISSNKRNGHLLSKNSKPYVPIRESGKL